jgi:hypothetical protein
MRFTFSIFSILLLTTPIAVSTLLFKTAAAQADESVVTISQPTQTAPKSLPEAGFNRTSAATLAPLAPATPETRLSLTPEFDQTTAQQLQDTPSTLAQVTSVSQLSDVQPTDWAFQALQSLVERYGVIAGYPDGTFRGNRAMTRYEFAAGLNAAMERINELITTGSADAVRKEDLETLNRLQSEFSNELASLRGRVDVLEAQTAQLEANQFSTTTVLGGEVIFGLASAFGGDPPGGCRVFPDNTGPFFDLYPSLPNAIAPTPGDANTKPEVDCLTRGKPDKNTVLAHLIRLGLETSFTGKDRLRTYLVTGNFDGGGFTNAESLNTYMARLSYQAGLENNVILDLLEYRFPAFNDRVVFSVIPFGFSLSNVLSANSAYFDTGRGSVSRFGEASPIFKLGGVLDAGAGFDWLFAKNARLQVAYGTGGSGDPDSGIFGADRSALGVQLLATPTNNLITGLTYVNAYTNDGTLGTFTGSVNAETNGLWSDSSIPPAGRNILDPNQLSGFEPCCGVYLGNVPAQTNAVGVTLQWRVAQNVTFGAWGGYMFTNFLEELPDGDEFRQAIGASAGKKPFANAATYLFSLGLSDPFGREGDLFAFLFGMPPKLVDAGPETPGTPVPFFETSRRGEPEVPVTDNNRNLDTVGVGPDNAAVEGPNLPRRVGVRDEATSLHFEMFYRFRLSDNIFITPGVVLVTNPGHIADNNDIWLATIRTTFRF